MMQTIHKYPFNLDTVFLSIPEGGNLLHCAKQNDGLYVWALVDTENILRAHMIDVSVTGGSAPTGMKYVGTFFDNGFVGHLWGEQK